MHMGNGQVTMMCAVLGGGIAALGAVAVASLARKYERPDSAKLAAASGFVFAMQALNLPVMSGVSGHLIGAFLLAYWFGSAWGFLATSMLLLIQTVLLGDGDWQTLGCNILNMAAIPCLIVYPMWNGWCSRSQGTGRLISIGMASYASVVLAAIGCSLELSASGTMRPMVFTHAAIGGIEVVATVAAIVIAPRLSLVWAPIGIAAVTAVAVLGSSPWPDGLEYSLARSSLLLVDETEQSASLINAAIALVVGSAIAMGAAHLLASVLPSAKQPAIPH